MTRSNTLRIFLAGVGLEIVKFLIILSTPNSLFKTRSLELLFIVFYYLSMLPVVLIFGVELGRPQTLIGWLGILILDVCWNALCVYLVILAWRVIKAIRRDW